MGKDSDNIMIKPATTESFDLVNQGGNPYATTTVEKDVLNTSIVNQGTEHNTTAGNISPAPNNPY
jgi:hypothetical protein